MVLPDRIELSTSPLPMECSTTELRQHARELLESALRPLQACRFLPQGPRWRKRVGRVITLQKPPKSAPGLDSLAPAPAGFPIFSAGATQALRHTPARPGSAYVSSIRLSSTSRHSNGSGMKDDQDKGERQAGVGARDSRQDRLKLALRENLKRRKSQARGRSDPAISSSGHRDAALNDASGKKPDR